MKKTIKKFQPPPPRTRKKLKFSNHRHRSKHRLTALVAMYTNGVGTWEVVRIYCQCMHIIKPRSPSHFRFEVACIFSIQTNILMDFFSFSLFLPYECWAGNERFIGEIFQKSIRKKSAYMTLDLLPYIRPWKEKFSKHT